MSTLAEIEKALEALPPEEKESLYSMLARQLGHAPQGGVQVARKAGLHAGAWSVAEDFDAPLPDEFWTGNEA